MPPETKTLVEADARWFVENVQRHESALRSYLRHSLSSAADVDDLAQECFVRVMRVQASARVGSPKALLFTIARNAVRDFLRRRAVADVIPLAEAQSPGAFVDTLDVAETVSRRQELSLLKEAIAELPERCRQVFLLRKIQGLSQREIAQRLGISENTVESLVATGTRRCGDFLRRRGVEGGAR
jgi:RNA polymerase sigma-70 factor (ECF subfamily)